MKQGGQRACFHEMHPVWSSAGSCSELSRKPLKRRKENIKVYFNMFYSYIMFHGLAMRN
jgi:hypothetical protein